MNIFVGNLSFESTEADVKKLFEGFGAVVSVMIVTEAKEAKSRGFGFVEMPDDAQANAAIVALNGADFMGRSLNVGPARTKSKSEHRAKKREKAQAEIKKDAWFKPVFEKSSGYKKGRRSQSYLKRRASEGKPEDGAVPKVKSHENPMRWRKKSEQTKPWHKKPEAFEPWKKAEGKSRPWQKADTEQKSTKPWNKAEGKNRQWWKSGEKSKPWKKSDSSAKSRKKY